MRRELFGVEVQQKSKSEFLSATDLVKAGNKWRGMNDMVVFNFSAWLNKKATVEFIAELEKVYGKVMTRGKKTWVHPYLFIDLALAISPKLKIEAYDWLHDHLLANRNDSGDSYKKMCGSLYVHQGDKREFAALIKTTASMIRAKVGVTSWQNASEVQLKERDLIHHEIALLANVLKHNEEAVRLTLLNH